MRVLCYPDIELAKDYPTLGPQGVARMDVNGFAGSVELYFGADVLLRADGTQTPVQWKGYEQTLQQYQGEAEDKGELQGKFVEKVRTCQSSPERIGEFDWSGMRAILDQLRTVFHD